MRIVITGAAGHVGRLATAALASHDLVLLDRRRLDDPRARAANLSRAPAPLSRLPKVRRWDRWFAGADAVLHLAAVVHPVGQGTGGWRLVRRHNIDATFHVLTAAAAHGVPKVVFGSSTWAVRGTLTAAHDARPRIGSDAFPRPLTRYGLSKAFGELAGRMFVDEGQLRTFVALRIGYAPPPGHVPAEGSTHDAWIGPQDLATLIRRTLEADLVGYHVVYGVSGVRACPYDLADTTRLLQWAPVEAGRTDDVPM
jgi:uronate dehydrogenase